MIERLLRLSGWILIAFCAALAGTAQASGVLESVKGDVRMAGPGSAPVAAAPAMVVEPGTSITTGNGAQAVLKFDDGGRVVLDHNTEMKLIDYRFDAGDPASGRAVFSFVTGAMRVATGRIAEARQTNFALQTPKATIGARSADFSVASGSLYVHVLKGAVTASNTGGTVTFGAGQYGFADTVWTQPVAITSAQLPTSVAQSFSRFSSEALAGGGAAGGAGGATGAAAGGGGLSGGALAALIAVGLAAAGGGGGGGGGSAPAATHH